MKITINILVLLVLLVSCNSNDSKKPVAPIVDHSKHAMIAGNADYCDSINNGLIDEDTLKGSPHRTTMETINGTHIHIEYGSPGVKGRIIWGGLVAYDKVWVTGAHNATVVQFSNAVEINNQIIPKGIYALFTIPGKEKWTVILNSRYEQHLADDYSEKEDLLRFIITPEESPMTQRLTYTIGKSDTDGSINMLWDKVKIVIPFKTLK